MNDFIAIVLMSKLLHLDYVEKFGGVVQTIQRTTKNQQGEQVVVRIPVSKAFRQFKDDQKDDQENRIEALRCGLNSKILEDFVPESKLSGLIYFEDNGVSPDPNKRHSMLDFWNARLRLVGWFNQKKFRNEFDSNFRSEAMLEIVQAIKTKRPVKQGVLHQFFVTVDSIPSIDASIFSSFDYNEAQSQFLTAPFDFFAIDLSISFATAKNCLINFTPEQIIC